MKLSPGDIQAAKEYEAQRVKAERHRLCRAAFEGGLRAVEVEPYTRMLSLSGDNPWWAELAPLTKLERRKVQSDVREFARALKEQRKEGPPA